jgi:hypothetical protein
LFTILLILGTPLVGSQPAASSPLTDIDPDFAPIWMPTDVSVITPYFYAKDLIGDLAVSPDGRYLASGKNKGSVTIWDLENGSELKTLFHEVDYGAVYQLSLAWHPDGSLLAVAVGDQVKLWEITTGRVVEGFRAYDVTSLDWTLSGDQLIVGTRSGLLMMYTSSGEIFELGEGGLHLPLKGSLGNPPSEIGFLGGSLYYLRGGNELWLDGVRYHTVGWSEVHCLEPMGDQLLIGTDIGLFRIEHRSGRFLDPILLLGHQIFSIDPTDDGFYVGTSAGLVEYDLHRGVIEEWTLGEVDDLEQVGNDLFMATADGVYHLDIQSGNMTLMWNGSNGLHESQISQLEELDDRLFMISGSGVSRWNLSGEVFLDPWITGDDLPEGSIAEVVDVDGRVYVGIGDQVFRTDTDLDSLEPWLDLDETVTCIEGDGEVLFFCHEGSISRYQLGALDLGRPIHDLALSPSGITLLVDFIGQGLDGYDIRTWELQFTIPGRSRTLDWEPTTGSAFASCIHKDLLIFSSVGVELTTIPSGCQGGLDWGPAGLLSGFAEVTDGSGVGRFAGDHGDPDRGPTADGLEPL